MSILMSVPLVTPCSNQLKLFSLNLYRSASAKVSAVGWIAPWAVTIWKDKALTLGHLRVSSHTTRHFRGHSFTDTGTFSFDWGDREFEDTEDLDSPWVGAIIYKRSSLVTHLEYCTTLERLGLEKLSTDVSRKRASAMGIRVTKDVKDFPNGTPVQISVDVSRKKKKLRLDGIVRTVLTLGCNRCGEPAAESVYTNFSLLLTEEPMEEPEVIDLGTIFGDGKAKSSVTNNSEEEEDDEVSIDPDDWLYFPPEEKEIDISKNIRDLVHVEITINAVCDPSCKGLCLQCGTNLNISSCKCKEEPVDDKVKGPFGNLKKQITTNWPTERQLTFHSLLAIDAPGIFRLPFTSYVQN